jgi:hypothetical protein
MVRKYEDVTETVTHKGCCTRVVCDMCGSEADHPELDSGMCWECGVVGIAGGIIEYSRSIDGEYEVWRRDLCPNCARWLTQAVGTNVKRPIGAEG